MYQNTLTIAPICLTSALRNETDDVQQKTIADFISCNNCLYGNSIDS